MSYWGLDLIVSSIERQGDWTECLYTVNLYIDATHIYIYRLIVMYYILYTDQMLKQFACYKLLYTFIMQFNIFVDMGRLF